MSFVPAEISMVGSFGFLFALFKGWIPYMDDLQFLTYILLLSGFGSMGLWSISETRFWLLADITGRKRAFLPAYVSRLNILDVLSLFSLVLIKYAVRPIGLVSRLRPAADGEHFALPQLRLSATIKIDSGDEQRYDAATRPDSKVDSAVSADRFLLFSALTTPMMTTLLANRNCPVMALGAINTRNRYELIDAPACRDPVRHLDLTRATVAAFMGGDGMLGRRVKRGMEFDINVEITAPRRGTKEIKLVFRQVFTILTLLPSRTKPEFKPSAAVESADEPAEEWNWSPAAYPAKTKVPGGLTLSLNSSYPRAWAWLSGDYNPIHMSSMLATVFGFSGKIAHGNHVVALALASVVDGASNDGQDSMRELLASDTPSVVDAQFRRPMVLPIKLGVEVGESGGKYGIRAVGSKEKGGKEHVTLQVAELKL